MRELRSVVSCSGDSGTCAGKMLDLESLGGGRVRLYGSLGSHFFGVCDRRFTEVLYRSNFYKHQKFQSRRIALGA